jgi:CDGSH-type Zn-finger protein
MAGVAREDQPPRVAIQPDSPYLVSGGVPIVTRTPVETEHGEPIAWSSGRPLPHPDRYALCRCGGSANKPFCDGTHNRNRFDGTETADTGPIAARRKDLEGTGIVVHDDRSICTHAGFCADRVTNVWKMMRDSGDTQVRANIAAMVERCPSGALAYSIAAKTWSPTSRSRSRSWRTGRCG